MYDLEEVLDRYDITIDELIEMLDAGLCPAEIEEDLYELE